MCLFRYSLVYQLTGQRLLRECTRVDAGCKTSTAAYIQPVSHLTHQIHCTGKKSWSALDPTVLARSIWLNSRKTFAYWFSCQISSASKKPRFNFFDTQVVWENWKVKGVFVFHRFHRLRCYSTTALSNVLSEKMKKTCKAHTKAGYTYIGVQ